MRIRAGQVWVGTHRHRQILYVDENKVYYRWWDDRPHFAKRGFVETNEDLEVFNLIIRDSQLDKRSIIKAFFDESQG